MAKIDGFRIQNFRSLRDITLGKLWNTKNAEPLTPLTAVIGKNGVGKSTLFDAFGFLADCLKKGVEEACDLRGGFERVRSQGQNGAIKFDVYYRENGNARPITYELAIDLDGAGRPYIQQERLRQEDKNNEKPVTFLMLNKGKGFAWKKDYVAVSQASDNKSDAKNKLQTDSLVAKLQDISWDSWESEASDIKATSDIIKLLEKIKVLNAALNKIGEYDAVEPVELSDERKLGIATLGSLKQHPRISCFREFIEGWYLSYFTPDAARSLPLAGPQKHLNIHGDNLGNVVQFMEREHKDRFKKILDRIAKKIPGIQKIDTEKTSDGRLLLRFNDRGFHDPFYAQQMSDGTLKVFAYLLLLEDPSPPPFICIEEPENGLYHKLLETLAQEFREHATGKKGGSQVFITTHQPYFVDALEPEEVWVLEKGEDGFATIRRASDDPLVENMVAEGLPLGGLWYSDYLDAR